MGTTYATPQVTIAASAFAEFTTAQAGLQGMAQASAHTIQVLGGGTARIEAQMAGAAGLSQIGDPATTGIYSFAGHNLTAIKVTNTGASAITITLAGG
jgi:hypothetical protein